jgi:hypothetical protein
VKRRPGILRNSVTALSLLLLCAALAAWVRGYFVSDQLILTTRAPVMWAVAYGKGRIDFVRATFDPSSFVETADSFAIEKPEAGWKVIHAKPEERDDLQLVPPEHEMRFLGAAYRSGKVLFMYVQNISLPMWILVLAFAIEPAIWTVRRRRRRGPGHCRACGYDIRATPQRCPECGAEVSLKPA